MADNRDLAALTGNAASEEVTHSGDTAHIQLIKPVGVTGNEGSKSVVEIVGSAGTPAAGVLTIQGHASATALPITDADGSLTVDDGGATLSIDDGGSTISIDDGGGAITVDGTVSVTGTVTVGSHAVTNAGTFVTQENGAALTALQLIDDAVFAEDAAHTTADKGFHVLGIRRDADTTPVNADGDYHSLVFDNEGNLKVNVKAGSSGGPLPIDSTTSAGLTSTGAESTQDVSTQALKFWSLQVKGNGDVPTSWSVDLEISLDGTNFVTVLTHTNTEVEDGGTMTTASPVLGLFYRINVTELTLGDADDIDVTAVGMQ